MGQSAGAGSPVWFRCHRERRGEGLDHEITLTGRSRPSRGKRGSAQGTRSTARDREYTCSCGHTGWSNHIDLARKAGEGWGDLRDQYGHA